MKERDTYGGAYDDIWTEVFKALETKELLTVSAVCTKFYVHISTTSKLWEAKFLEGGSDLKKVEDDYMPKCTSDVLWKWRWLFSSWKSKGKLVYVLYDFEAQEDNELSMKEGKSAAITFNALGEVLRVVDEDSSGWWLAMNDKGKSGYVPSNYLEFHLKI